MVWYIKCFIAKRTNPTLKMYYGSRFKKATFGKSVSLYEKVQLKNVRIEDYSYVAYGSFIQNAVIGKFCSIGPDCKIGLGKHPISAFVSSHPMFYSTLKQSQIKLGDSQLFNEYEEIKIGNDVWIGANVIIIDGVKIGDGAMIAAGAVVSNNVEPYAIVGGVPAKHIKYRFGKQQIEWLLKFEWWKKDFEWISTNYIKFQDINKFIQVFDE
jgi:acetyltransferase-like isoleucine patch superfamily enzyme